MKSEQKYPTLFSPLTIGGVSLKNRLVHASITTRYVTSGEVTSTLINYCVNRARGGAAMIVTEPMNLHSGQKDPRRVHVFAESNTDAIKRWVDAVEVEDCRLLAQIQDPGRGRHEQGRSHLSIGASPLPDDISWGVPHALAAGEIERLIAELVQSCLILKKLGFSGVEISAGHGHLFHQFLSAWSNRREDDYGGDLAGRTRLLRTLIEEIRLRCGRNFVIGVKLPGEDGMAGGIDLEEAGKIASAVAATNAIDYWTFAWGTHASTLDWHVPDMHGPRIPYIDKINQLRRNAPSIPAGALGLITDPNECERVLKNGSVDLVMLGRALITDPAWGVKSSEGREHEIRYCVSCNTCWQSIVEHDHLQCDNNPRVGLVDEADWRPQRVKKSKKIIVVGTGIAGMEAAWVTAARGHEVQLFGMSDAAGGKTRLHAALPGGENLSSIYDYQWSACQQHKVTIELGVEVTPEDVMGFEADAVILATGSRMSWPTFLPEEYQSDILFPDLRTLVSVFVKRGGREPGRVLIVDKDHTQMTYAAAELLADKFDEVVLVTPRERIAADVSLVNRQGIYRRLYQKHVRIITSSEPLKASPFEEGKVRIANIYNGDEYELDDIAAVTYSTHRLPNDDLVLPLRLRSIDTHLIGDCYAPRSVLAATSEGHDLGNRL